MACGVWYGRGRVCVGACVCGVCVVRVVCVVRERERERLGLDRTGVMGASALRFISMATVKLYKTRHKDRLRLREDSVVDCTLAHDTADQVGPPFFL